MSLKLHAKNDGSIEIQNGSGTPVLTIDAAGDITDINGEGFFGKGQTWQDMSGSRAFDTVYTNTTDTDIQLYINIRLGTSDDATFVYDGTLSTLLEGGSAVTLPSVFITVKPGETYELQNTTSTPIITSWWELRA